MAMHINPIPIFDDNYVWVVRRQSSDQQVIIVDPGDAEPVIKWLEKNSLVPVAIFITHHHYDHVNGVNKILEVFQGDSQGDSTIPVYGPATETIVCVSHPLIGGQQVTVSQLGLTFQVLDLPGHTLGHIAYLRDDALFSGDTLFSAGCGRLFEGTPAQMYQSLMLLADLPDETKVYCTHEYTLSNLAFATSIEPDNCDITAYAKIVREQRAAGHPSLPTTIGREKQINPFLRVTHPDVISSVCRQANIEEKNKNNVDIFAALRLLKDTF